MTTQTRAKGGQALTAAIDAATDEFGPTMTTPQFASLAHVTDRTIHAWRSKGVGPTPWKVASRWHYSTADVVRFVHGAK
ncbi:putative MerR family transcriptional regulator [Gordonia namibiensis NBRC 108229]|uniref:Putative MerR family transcriptional regulator n=1 Tax=Gordonia namibiensis NBRC 108229 TaxID=1208314 RepID=K6WMA7_9ACTN|nr:helix-turn-helix domain-containing protein [Gordonia namibiensis]GAC00536.1 putative MerR family transcriptional regulator [Gordonia namibiensis NBRC 108229]